MCIDSSPQISVVCCFHDLEATVAYCLDSILSQDFDDYEVVCVDDGSLDGTCALLDSYADAHERVRVFHEAHNGISAARNFGVRQARGTYVSFVDGDDFVSPHYLSILHAAMGRRHDLFVKAKNIRGPLEEVRTHVWNDAATVEELSPHDALRRFLTGEISMVVWACLAERTLYLKHPLREDIMFEDHHITPEHIAASGAVAYVKTPIYAYVSRKGSLTHSGNDDPYLPLSMSEAIANILRLSRDWDADLMPYVAWAVCVRCALTISYCTNQQENAHLVHLCRRLSTYMQEHLSEAVWVYRQERGRDPHVSRQQLSKILVAAAGPRVYWTWRKVYRALTNAQD